jgi:hypothetical protein
MVRAADATTPGHGAPDYGDSSVGGSSKRTRTDTMFSMSQNDASVAGGASNHTRLTGGLEGVRLDGPSSGRGRGRSSQTVRCAMLHTACRS